MISEIPHNTEDGLPMPTVQYISHVSTIQPPYQPFQTNNDIPFNGIPYNEPQPIYYQQPQYYPAYLPSQHVIPSPKPFKSFVKY